MLPSYQIEGSDFMKYMDFGCNINCWECNEKCGFKEILQISIYLPFIEQYVYSEIMEKLKAQAGQLYLSGISIEVLNEEIKVLAVSFYVARLKLKEQLLP